VSGFDVVIVCSRHPDDRVFDIWAMAADYE
jgi:hypothetical protein